MLPLHPRILAAWSLCSSLFSFPGRDVEAQSSLGKGKGYSKSSPVLSPLPVAFVLTLDLCPLPWLAATYQGWTATILSLWPWWVFFLWPW